MNNEQIIIITFRLLNFGALIGLAYYGWKRYGRSHIVQEYEKEQAHMESLTAKHSSLRQQERYLHKAYADDEQQRTELKERLFIWRDAVQKEQEEIAAHKERRIKQVNEQAQQQVQRMVNYRVYQKVKREAIDQMRTNLAQEFAAAPKQKQVIASIMKRLESA